METLYHKSETNKRGTPYIPIAKARGFTANFEKQNKEYAYIIFSLNIERKKRIQRKNKK